ncbi:MAG: adenylosuccinate synthase [Anaerolineae bacterium]|nr:adenylosuccinate synthase [Anaerolineae bacterium]
MPLNIIIGTQWGDEGKGRITDLLAEQVNVVARYSGGDNAGHTLTIQGEIFKLHLIPSGIIHPGVLCLIGTGVVINPKVLLHEMEGLRQRGIDVSPARLKICANAHLITPAHIALDKANELGRGREAIGTTLRGIGPAYTDKANRSGLRAGLLAEPEALAEAIYAHIEEKNRLLERIYEQPGLDAAAAAAEYAAYAQQLAPYLTNGPILLDEALQQGQTILAEGAQGTLLDINHGTYPFVTSSSPTSSGALVGLGVGPRVVGQVLGVAKAFTSRVGSGPFPSELEGDEAVRLRGTGSNPWDEYGTTTGRPRRVGWLDLVILNHAQRINGLTELALTKLDILSGLEQIPVCVGYELDGESIHYFPTDLQQLARCRPIYQILPGWSEDVTHARTLDDLPENAQQYINFISTQTGLPIRLVSVGPNRSQVINFSEP